MLMNDTDCPLCNSQQRSQPPLALAVPLSRFPSRVGGGSAFYVRHHGHATNNAEQDRHKGLGFCFWHLFSWRSTARHLLVVGDIDRLAMQLGLSALRRSSSFHTSDGYSH